VQRKEQYMQEVDINREGRHDVGTVKRIDM